MKKKLNCAFYNTADLQEHRLQNTDEHLDVWLFLLDTW